MANVHKGEVGFEVAGKPYRLVFSTNALCDMEGVLDLGINEIGAQLNAKRIRVSVVRAALWAGLLAEHPELTIKDAGNLVQELTAVVALAKVTEAMTAAFPQKTEGEGAAPNPQ